MYKATFTKPFKITQITSKPNSKDPSKYYYQIGCLDPLSGDFINLGCSSVTADKAKHFIDEDPDVTLQVSVSFEFFSGKYQSNGADVNVGGYKAFCFNVCK